jgi:hypothetical protein
MTKLNPIIYALTHGMNKAPRPSALLHQLLLKKNVGRQYPTRGQLVVDDVNHG